jgi:hypothetical protein
VHLLKEQRTEELHKLKSQVLTQAKDRSQQQLKLQTKTVLLKPR